VREGRALGRAGERRERHVGDADGAVVVARGLRVEVSVGLRVVCVRACARVCVCACVRACVCACNISKAAPVFYVSRVWGNDIASDFSWENEGSGLTDSAKSCKMTRATKIAMTWVPNTLLRVPR
jgi:hypothetical protein